MRSWSFLEAELQRLEAERLLRQPDVEGRARARAVDAAQSLGVGFIDASSNDYLGFARWGVSRETSFSSSVPADATGGRVVSGPAAPGVSRETSFRSDTPPAPQPPVPPRLATTPSDHDLAQARDAYPSVLSARHAATRAAPGSGSSRLIHGSHQAHAALEALLAEWVGFEAALLFASGYAANVSLIPALTRPGDLIVSDELNHASLIDGCRLSRAETVVVPHIDVHATERALRAHRERSPDANRWVVTESVFSMDGDSPDLVRLRALCDTHGAGLILDEAHALGVYGEQGAGKSVDARMQPDVFIGTLGKSVGTHGAFVAGPLLLRTWLWNRARGFVFSTAPSPALAELTIEHVRAVRSADDLRERLWSNVTRFGALLAARYPQLARHKCPIFPIPFGTTEAALRAAEQLAQAGILSQAIRPPTVPPGSSRLRVTITAAHEPSDIDRLAATLLSLGAP